MSLESRGMSTIWDYVGSFEYRMFAYCSRRLTLIQSQATPRFTGSRKETQLNLLAEEVRRPKLNV